MPLLSNRLLLIAAGQLESHLDQVLAESATFEARVGEFQNMIESLDDALETARQRVVELDRRATRAEESLGVTRAKLRELEGGARTRSAPESAQSREAAGDAESPGTRRRAFRIGRGLDDDSAEGISGLMAIDGIRVFVDGYNVAMLGWPMLDLRYQRRALLGALVGSLGWH